MSIFRLNLKFRVFYDTLSIFFGFLSIVGNDQDAPDKIRCKHISYGSHVSS